MKKFIIVTVLLCFTAINSNAQTTAPIPSCACNNIAAQLNNGKIDRQTQKEMEEMDKEANRLDNKLTRPTQQSENNKKHKWFWQR